VARAGAVDIPDIGAEALARGGAFVAKADDGTALYYNVAGLAQQRGTRVTFDANLFLHDTAFTRAGVYPGDPTNPHTPWGGAPYPTIHDGDGAFIVPFFALSSDFNYFKRLTFGFALYGPPGIGQHDYSGDVATQVKQPNGTLATVMAPSPARYDIARTNLLILMPTWGAAYRISKLLDVGLAVQWVYSRFGLSNANITNIGPSTCIGSPDYPGCDSYGQINVSGNTYGFLVSALAHPLPWIDVGLSYRPQIDIHATGTLNAVPPPGQAQLPPTPGVNFNTMLAHWVRLGVRATSHYDDGTERGDIEIDATYENWGNRKDRWGRDITDPSQRLDHVYTDQFALGTGVLDVNLNHGYQDTFGIRVGGAYNWRLSDVSRLSARLGAYFDSAATDYAHNRLDFDTSSKWAFTCGLGYKLRGFSVHVAYAYVYSPNRNVSDSANTAVSATNGTNYGAADPIIPVGNGLYEASIHILSIGLGFNLNEFGRSTLYPH
jgi:long-chain fatty acid transport protein